MSLEPNPKQALPVKLIMHAKVVKNKPKTTILVLHPLTSPSKIDPNILLVDIHLIGRLTKSRYQSLSIKIDESQVLGGNLQGTKLLVFNKKSIM